MNESQLRIYAEKRLKLPPAAGLALQTFIPTALNNLARDVANDYTKRRLLLTNNSVVTSSITSSAGKYSSDLSTIVDTYGVMVDYLQYGTIYHYFNQAYASAAVTVSPANSIDLPAHPFVTGDPVVLAPVGAGVLAAPFVAGTTYYTIKVGGNQIKLAVSEALAEAGTPITITNAGSGSTTITGEEQNTVQWLDDAEFASLARSLPVQLVYGWMEDESRLRISGVTSGTLAFAVPYIPTLDNLNPQLDQDLIDELVSVAVSGGIESVTEAQK